MEELRVPCPICEAPAGARCLGVETGLPMVGVHYARTHAFKASQTVDWVKEVIKKPKKAKLTLEQRVERREKIKELVRAKEAAERAETQALSRLSPGYVHEEEHLLSVEGNFRIPRHYPYDVDEY